MGIVRDKAGSGLEDVEATSLSEQALATSEAQSGHSPPVPACQAPSPPLFWSPKTQGHNGPEGDCNPTAWVQFWPVYLLDR